MPSEASPWGTISVLIFHNFFWPGIVALIPGMGSEVLRTVWLPTARTPSINVSGRPPKKIISPIGTSGSMPSSAPIFEAWKNTKAHRREDSSIRPGTYRPTSTTMRSIKPISTPVLSCWPMECPLTRASRSRKATTATTSRALPISEGLTFCPW